MSQQPTASADASLEEEQKEFLKACVAEYEACFDKMSGVITALEDLQRRLQYRVSDLTVQREHGADGHYVDAALAQDIFHGLAAFCDEIADEAESIKNRMHSAVANNFTVDA